MSEDNIFKAKNLLIDLVKTYAPTGHEYRLEPVLRKWSNELGYDEFYIDEVGNIFLRCGSGNRTILLASHLDTVPGELDVKIDGDTVWGRGAVDARGPLAAFILGAVWGSFERSNSRVYVAGLVQEEGSGLGARHLVENNFKADHIIVGEPTNLGIAIAYRGSISLRISSNTIGGHSSAPYIGESALDKLLQFIDLLKNRFNGASYEEVSYAVTFIRAGEWFGSLPETGEAYINIRYPPRFNSRDIIEELESFARVTGIELQIGSIDKPVEVSVNVEVVRALVKSFLKMGMKPRIVKKTGTSDMNTLVDISKSIAGFGPGDSKLAHTRYEKISIDDVILGARIISNTLLELSSVGLNRDNLRDPVL
ncbi:MAG: N-acetyl-lysine deacetylase [Nitrososphaeria archaeon]|nr:N-acetyl-lysine deacetylase [Nitrososphaeria archaeon]